MSLLQIQSAIGLLLLAGLAWALGGFRRGVAPRVIVAGIALQIALAAILLNVPPVRATFFLLGDAVDALATATRAGTSLVFGYLGGGPLPYVETGPAPPSSCSSRRCRWCWWSARCRRCCTTGASCPRWCGRWPAC